MDLFDIAQLFLRASFPVDARNLHQGAVLSGEIRSPVQARSFVLFRVADGTDFFVEDMRDAEKIRSLFYPGIDDIAGHIA